MVRNLIWKFQVYKMSIYANKYIRIDFKNVSIWLIKAKWAMKCENLKQMKLRRKFKHVQSNKYGLYDFCLLFVFVSSYLECIFSDGWYEKITPINFNSLSIEYIRNLETYENLCDMLLPCFSLAIFSAFVVWPCSNPSCPLDIKLWK